MPSCAYNDWCWWVDWSPQGESACVSADWTVMPSVLFSPDNSDLENPVMNCDKIPRFLASHVAMGDQIQEDEI